MSVSMRLLDTCRARRRPPQWSDIFTIIFSSAWDFQTLSGDAQETIWCWELNLARNMKCMPWSQETQYYFESKLGTDMVLWYIPLEMQILMNHARQSQRGIKEIFILTQTALSWKNCCFHSTTWITCIWELSLCHSESYESTDLCSITDHRSVPQ